MSELQQNRYDQLLRRIGDLKGPGSKVSDVISELFPMIDVERVPGELLILGGTALCQGAAGVGPSAGNTPRTQIFNPANSGALITITTVLISVGSTLIVRIATVVNALTTGVGTEVFRERRRAITARPIGQYRTDLTVAQTDAHLSFRLQANNTFVLTDPNGLAVLPPGTGYEIGTDTVNSILNASYLWRERAAESSELNL